MSQYGVCTVCCAEHSTQYTINVHLLVNELRELIPAFRQAYLLTTGFAECVIVT